MPSGASSSSLGSSLTVLATLRGIAAVARASRVMLNLPRAAIERLDPSSVLFANAPNAQVILAFEGAKADMTQPVSFDYLCLLCGESTV